MKNENTPVMEVENLTIRFSRRNAADILAVRAVSMVIGERETVALVGESGSGKTTTGRALVRLIRPTIGTLRFKGHDVTRIRGHQLKNYHKDAQLIFQDPFASLNPFHTVAYQIQRPLIKLRHMSGQDARQAVGELLVKVGLTPTATYAEKYPHELSGGQRQRVSIARSLAGNPSLVVADEPVSMLDVSLRAEILSLLKSLQEGRKLSYLYITHDLASARYLSHRIAVMYGGSIVEVTGADNLIKSPAHPYTHLLLAASVGSVATSLPETQPGSPDLTEFRTGCPFAPRCPQVMDRCWQEMPPLLDVEPEHSVACFLHHSP